MEKMFKVKMDIIDTLDHAEAKIAFMCEACIGIGKNEDAIDEQAAFGMMLVFNEIRDQVAAVNKELYKNIKNDEVVSLEKGASAG
jgi:hypothetical protein